MKAAVIHEYGDPGVLRLEEMPVPVLRKGELLLRVFAAGVNPVDWKQRKGNHKFFLKARFPVILGYDVSGVVEKTGPGTKQFKPGDEVYSRLRRKFGGAFAEYAAAPESSTALKPSNLDHLHAAGLPLAGQTALQALRDKARLVPGMKILITGAAGGVGHFALQLARHFGAETTAVCSSRHRKLLATLKPDHHIDYTKTNYLKGPATYDVVFDAAGVTGFPECRKILKKGGVFVTSLPRPKLLWHKLLSVFSGGRKVRSLLQRPRSRDLQILTGLVEKGEIQVIVDSVHPLERASEAHRRAEEYSTEGKIIIRIR